MFAFRIKVESSAPDEKATSLMLQQASDRPPETSVTSSASKHLQLLQELEVRGLGEILKIEPYLDPLLIEPKYGKCLLFACFLKCVDSVVTIVSALSLRYLF